MAVIGTDSLYFIIQHFKIYCSYICQHVERSMGLNHVLENKLKEYKGSISLIRNWRLGETQSLYLNYLSPWYHYSTVND